jgi:hypothetical protein
MGSSGTEAACQREATSKKAGAERKRLLDQIAAAQRSVFCKANKVSGRQTQKDRGGSRCRETEVPVVEGVGRTGRAGEIKKRDKNNKLIGTKADQCR